MTGPSESFTTVRDFQQTPHSVAVSCDLQRLSIAVEQLTDSSQWSADYPLELVEQITSKAGSFKPFAVFLRMLLAGLQQESETVDVELLTYGDLDSPSSSSLGTEAERPATTLATRRYLIVTHSTEFDRIQYPLPLQYVSNPDPAYLKAIILELRSRKPDGQVRQNHAEEQPAKVQQLRGDVLTLQRKLQKQAHVQEELQTAQTQIGALSRQLQEVAKERDLLACKLQESETHAPLLPRARRWSASRYQERGSPARVRSGIGYAQEGTPPLQRRSSDHAASYSKWPTRQSGRRSWDSGSDLSMPSHSTGLADTRAARTSHQYTGRMEEPSSRSRSAPARRPRFDPTEYVRQQLDRYGQPRYERSPVPSRAASRSPSPSFRSSSAGEDGAVLDRLRRPTASFRARSGSPDPRQGSRDSRQGGRPPQAWPRRAHSPAPEVHERALRSPSPARSRPPRQSSPMPAGISGRPRGHGNVPGSSPMYPHAGQGRLSQGAKENRRPASPLGPHSLLPSSQPQRSSYPFTRTAPMPPTGKAKGPLRDLRQSPEPASEQESEQNVDLASIDARLAKLQSFLQAARAGRPST